jgi:hypothetical protein
MSFRGHINMTPTQTRVKLFLAAYLGAPEAELFAKNSLATVTAAGMVEPIKAVALLVVLVVEQGAQVELGVRLVTKMGTASVVLVSIEGLEFCPGGVALLLLVVIYRPEGVDVGIGVRSGLRVAVFSLGSFKLGGGVVLQIAKGGQRALSRFDGTRRSCTGAQQQQPAGRACVRGVGWIIVGRREALTR